MKNLLKNIYRTAIPSELRERVSSTIANRNHNIYLKKLRRDFLVFYENEEKISEEQSEVVNYVKKNAIKIFPYSFTEKYDKQNIQVHYDQAKDLKYVLHDKKKMYFKRSMNENAIRSLYYGLLIDQDPASPHRYLAKDFNVAKDDVVVDAGAAEGNFSLSVVEKVKYIYLFESDPSWIEPLQATFEPWKNKIKIISKTISDKSNNGKVALDDFYLEHPFNFVKADIEGDENLLLYGFRRNLQRANEFKIAICTYHKQEDFARFSRILREHHYKISTPRGYMIFYYDLKLKAPYVRRGLIRAQKNV